MTGDWEEPTFDDLPNTALPYDGTEGASGSSTSTDRAEHEVTSGAARRRQHEVVALLRTRRAFGVTVREMGVALGVNHHGTASGSLSAMHKEGLIRRLTEQRNRQKVYVLPEYVQRRDVEAQGRVNPVSEALRDWLLKPDAVTISRAQTDPRGFVEAMRRASGHGASDCAPS